MVGALEEATVYGIPSGQVQKLTVGVWSVWAKDQVCGIRQGDQQQFGIQIIPTGEVTGDVTLPATVALDTFKPTIGNDPY
jgi:hypothetical protein